jgi:hypothetical protein
MEDSEATESIGFGRDECELPAKAIDGTASTTAPDKHRAVRRRIRRRYIQGPPAAYTPTRSALYRLSRFIPPAKTLENQNDSRDSAIAQLL